MKLKLNTKRLYTTNSVKHLGIKVDENLNWRQQINNVAVKLNRAYAMLSKVRNFVDKKLLNQSITQFLHHIYSIPVLFGHRILTPLKILYVLQKKSLRLSYFLNRNNIQFLSTNILKFSDKVALENCVFIKNYFNQTLPTPFKNWFTLSIDPHIHNRFI